MIDWRYANKGPLVDHSLLEVNPDQSARLRQVTVITIRDGSSATFQDKVTDFFGFSAPIDLAIPGQSLCPSCADGLRQTMCDWTLLPWSPDTAPGRILSRSASVFEGIHGQPMSPSLTFTKGASYSLVGVSYFVVLYNDYRTGDFLSGDRSQRDHLVSQVRIRGRWHKYDYLDGGTISS